VSSSVVERMSIAAHEIVRAYCHSIGDFTLPPWNEASEDQKEVTRHGVLFHLANSEAGPEGSHIRWVESMVSRGWRWGPFKNVAKQEHPCIVPFNRLPRYEKTKDFLFCAVVYNIKDSF